MRAAAVASSIRDLRPMEQMKVKLIYTDAAGGAEGKIKNGIGGYSPPSNWFYMPWPVRVQFNIPTSLGVRFASKLSALEGFAALVGLVSMPNEVRNCEVRLLCDNAGFVYSYQAKSSKCAYVYSIAKAINDVSEGLACKVKVVKTPRCSNTKHYSVRASITTLCTAHTIQVHQCLYMNVFSQLGVQCTSCTECTSITAHLSSVHSVLIVRSVLNVHLVSAGVPVRASWPRMH